MLFKNSSLKKAKRRDAMMQSFYYKRFVTCVINECGTKRHIFVRIKAF